MSNLWRIKIGNLYLLKGDFQNLELIQMTANKEKAFLFGSKKLVESYAARIGGITESAPYTSKRVVPPVVTNPGAWEHIRNEFIIEPARANLN